MKQKCHSNGIVTYRINIKIINCLQIYQESLCLAIDHVDLIGSWIIEGAHGEVFRVGFEDVGHD